MSSRSLAAARSRRAGENAPPVSGNRPITSIGSQAAFAQQIPVGNSNVRVARGIPPPQQQMNRPQQFQQQQQYYEQPPQSPQQPTNGLPFSKLSISDAIGLITLRLGRVEQWIIETDHESEGQSKPSEGNYDMPTNHRIIDNSVLTTIINRLDSLEKREGSSGVNSTEDVTKLKEEVNTLNEQLKRIGDDVTKHTLELAKNTEQVFRFNRELTETKDILKSFMVKYDMFTNEITQNFTDYEAALGDLEKRLLPESGDSQEQASEDNGNTETETETEVETENGTSIMSSDLKNLIRQEFANAK